MATGHAWTPMVALCYRCTCDLITWLKRREKAFLRPWRKPPSDTTFIAAALSSVRA